jgi:hypothetical protein
LVYFLLSFKYKVFIGVIGIMARTLQVESINSSSTGLDLQTLGSSRLFIKNDGNIGIGSTNPQDDLDMGSPTEGRGITWAGINGASRYNSIFSSFSVAGLVFSAGFHGSASADSYISSFTGTQGLAGIRFDSFGVVAGVIRFFTDAAVSRTAGGTVVPTERLRITASGGISFGSSGTAYGTSGQFLTSQGNAAPTWTTLSYSTLTLGTSGTGLTGSATYTPAGAATFTVTSNATSANTASAIVARDATNNFSAGTITANLTGNVTGNTSGSSGSCTGNSATATNLSTNRTNWSTNGTISAVVGQLAWKNFSNSHTIFDASNSTSPDGGAVNNTNSAIAWTASYPTLMGWNGLNTYGVRVDSARLADSATTASTANALTTGNNYQVNSLGVGTAASGSAGEIRAVGNITAYYGLSDKRLKENITPLKNVLKKLENINGYNFNYKTRPNQKMVGVIAQELLEEFPELIYETVPIDETSGLDKAYAVRYELLTSILLQAIKELSSEVNKLKNNK